MSSKPLQPGATGTVIYLAVDDPLDAALARVAQAGGKVAVGRTELPGDMGCYAHIIDTEGNRVGLHATN
jgi:predicted enzyme related to lactoylglutathione lyase